MEGSQAEGGRTAVNGIFNHVRNLGNLQILSVLDNGNPCFPHAFKEKRKSDQEEPFHFVSFGYQIEQILC